MLNIQNSHKNKSYEKQVIVTL